MDGTSKQDAGLSRPGSKLNPNSGGLEFELNSRADLVWTSFHQTAAPAPRLELPLRSGLTVHTGMLCTTGMNDLRRVMSVSQGAGGSATWLAGSLQPPRRSAEMIHPRKGMNKHARLTTQTSILDEARACKGHEAQGSGPATNPQDAGPPAMQLLRCQFKKRFLRRA